VQLVGSTAHYRSAGKVFVDAPARRIAKLRKAGGRSIRFRRTSRGAWVYAVRRGHVRAVAMASRALARHPKALRTAMRRLLAAKATSRKRKFIPSDATAAAGAPSGKPLAGTSDPKINAALALLCSMQAGGTNGAAAPPALR
jgi:hypothetical protein